MKSKVMKSYTDISQSKKLAEILPIESADMKILPFTKKEYRIVPINDISVCGREDEIYAWSLAALLNAVDFSTTNLHYDNARKDWVASATIHDSTKHCTKYESTRALNPVDACVEMIIKLKENNLL